MLVTRLNTDQRRVFLALAYRLALSDHWVPDPEDQFLSKLLFDVGLNEKVNPMDVMGDPDMTPMDTRESRLIVMLELMALAYSDSTYHANESEVMAHIAHTLEIAADDLDRCRDWGQRQAGVMQQIHKALPPKAA